MRVRRILLASGILCPMLALSGVAWGYWTTTGAGTGQASVTGTAPGLNLHAGTVGDLLPGTAVSVQLSADNHSATELQVGVVHLETVTADRPGCDVADFQMADVPVQQLVSPHRTGFVLSATGLLQYANTTVDQSGCSGARLTLTISSR